MLWLHPYFFLLRCECLRSPLFKHTVTVHAVIPVCEASARYVVICAAREQQRNRYCSRYAQTVTDFADASHAESAKSRNHYVILRNFQFRKFLP